VTTAASRYCDLTTAREIADCGRVTALPEISVSEPDEELML
jgi:hypothetical protein